MYLDSRNSGFILLFPPEFYDPELRRIYKTFVKQMMLPYETLDDFMSSTIQSITFPSWDMSMPTQIRMHGAEQNFKSAKPIKDLFDRELIMTFKVVDGFINYFLFMDNAIRYLDFNNTTKRQYFEIMRLGLLSREGYLIAYIDFRKCVLHGMSNFKMSYTSVSQEMSTFDAKFKYNDWNIMSLVEDFNPVPITNGPLSYMHYNF